MIITILYAICVMLYLCLFYVLCYMLVEHTAYRDTYRYTTCPDVHIACCDAYCECNTKCEWTSSGDHANHSNNRRTAYCAPGLLGPFASSRIKYLVHITLLHKKWTMICIYLGPTQQHYQYHVNTLVSNQCEMQLFVYI